MSVATECQAMPRAVPIEHTSEALWVHATIGRLGWSLVHTASGYTVCEAPTAAIAIELGVRLWDELTEDGREVLRRNPPYLVKWLPKCDAKLLLVVATEAERMYRDHFHPPRQAR